MGPLANGTLCLSTPKHNGKSGTGHTLSFMTRIVSYSSINYNTIYSINCGIVIIVLI